MGEKRKAQEGGGGASAENQVRLRAQERRRLRRRGRVLSWSGAARWGEVRAAADFWPEGSRRSRVGQRWAKLAHNGGERAPKERGLWASRLRWGFPWRAASLTQFPARPVRAAEEAMDNFFGRVSGRQRGEREPQRVDYRPNLILTSWPARCGSKKTKKRYFWVFCCAITSALVSWSYV